MSSNTKESHPTGITQLFFGQALKGVELIVSDACMGLVEAVGELYPDAQWQRCVVHWYRNVFSHVPSTKVRAVALMLKAIHAQESREAALAKAREVHAKLRAMKLGLSGFPCAVVHIMGKKETDYVATQGAGDPG